ncbi:glucosamine-6-phosphate isomerases/6-phosphogluconolactonase-domain-containing protein [Thamnocephalis sphaerospora]|uniref:6-phosphogluconolactonase n=1 Tax=Thamnocephalis sphaerospora TaxID=78915 RepID=A0A4P9XP91_9FUNG|nr:glucosamine-6-phosphate isomerases/6-phosphogluconolactonase-domain-containing protein [Thamnocephalis sphaerospora]|eukprot:RKP07796.1 glucosamine-6-phosphate isomerases/6-phosphogluconolactonase-domain-containing protein [Thamnocephalis sphaerospora]
MTDSKETAPAFVPHDSPPAPKIYRETDLIEPLAAYVAKVAQDAISHHGRFTVAISGGSLPSQLRGLLAPGIRDTIDWSRWHVFLADERLVPLDHEDSNYRLLREQLISHIPDLDSRTYPIEASLVDNPEEAADAYIETMRRVFAAKESVKFPVFDLILLGMGPDGHTCSLFPGHKLLQRRSTWVASLTDSPKPPPQRITLTLPVINHAHHVAFVCAGGSKRDALRAILGQKTPEEQEAVKDNLLPAARVQPAHGYLVWFLDEAAAAALDDLEPIVTPTQYKL